MTFVDQVPNELAKLLVDVQRTIRENELFIRSLKKEAVYSAEPDSDGEADCGGSADDDDYVEL